MISEMRKLKYISTIIPVQIFDTGLESWSNIETLFSQPVRNRVICRFDMVNLLNDYFSKTSLEKYRDEIYFIATGELRDPDTMASIIEAFLEEDKQFHNGIQKIFHNCPFDKTLGEYIAIELAMVMLTYQKELTEQLTGRGEFVICNSDGYLYLSVPDVEGYDLYVNNPEEYKELYNGKSWRTNC